MAQRAYRQRKESTLDELRKRVSDLTNTIEVMNKTFGDFRDRLYASDVSEFYLMDLQDISVEFETLVRDVRNPNDDCKSYILSQARIIPGGPVELSVLRSNLNTDLYWPLVQSVLTRTQIVDQEPVKEVPRGSVSSRTFETYTAGNIQAKNVPSWLDESVVASSMKPKLNGATAAPLGYSIEVEDTSPAVDYSKIPLEPQDFNLSKSLKPSWADSMEIWRPEALGSHSIPLSLKPPITYSFQETSIARRLHRACAETAYSLICDPTRKPADFERIFRLSLLGRDRTKIAASLKSILDRGPHEDLDFWEAPLIHVGGAGTHYPRRDAFGNLLPRKNTRNIGLIGPQTLALLQDDSRASITADMTVELAGFEGEWLDPHDVQGYLEEKGIFIDPTASFAEAEIVECPHTSNTSSSASLTSPQTPPASANSGGRATPLTEAQVIKLIKEAEADLSQWNDFTNM